MHITRQLSHRRAYHEGTYFVGPRSCLLRGIVSRRHIIRSIQRILESGVRNPVGDVRPDLQFYGQHFEWNRDAPKPCEVQRLRAKLGVRSRVRRGTRQVRIWIWPIVWLFRQGHVERPLGKRTMCGILDRPEKLNATESRPAASGAKRPPTWKPVVDDRRSVCLAIFKASSTSIPR